MNKPTRQFYCRVLAGIKSRRVVLSLVFALMAMYCVAQQPGGDATAPGQILVQFKQGIADSKKKEVLVKHALKEKKHLKTQAMRAAGHPGLTLVESADLVSISVEKLKKEPEVDFAEPNFRYRHHAVANDPQYSAGNLWGLADSSSFGSRVSAAWASGYTGTNTVYVGVIDEGVEWQHPDVSANIWTNPFDSADGLDNDGNGIADDTHGWDFYYWDATVYDSGEDAHGTHVAGTIGAVGGNNRGVVGVNWKVTMIPAKFLGPEGGFTSDAVQAIDYFVDLKTRHNLKIVALNCSWGSSSYSQALHDALLRAAKAGILIVAAAGNGDDAGVAMNNETTPHYPSNYDTTVATTTETAPSYNAVVSVAAIDRNGALASFSNYGATCVHLGAPGVSILSTLPEGQYGYYDGTSMATPHVTGGLALYASTHPAASAAQIRQALLTAAAPTSSLAGKSTTGGRLDLRTVIAPAANSNIASRFENPYKSGNQFRVTLAGTAGQTYEVQVSTDLKNWSTLKTVTNTTGTIQITDSITSGLAKKFYRALSR